MIIKRNQRYNSCTADKFLKGVLSMKDIFEEIGKVLSETAETVSNKAGEVV